MDLSTGILYCIVNTKIFFVLPILPEVIILFPTKVIMNVNCYDGMFPNLLVIVSLTGQC